ncbi:MULTISPECIES: cytochrome-c oxidase, cbb3-type subunit III [unclassified Rhizobacter]|uniref:cytochrome-c oxidase, cbb3-type subunit III n=1 Tax=unclassified Rhizobacter TaxID=2640088 RepID=UPI0006F4E992|nr:MULTISPECIES: cytochrome-c oxidase, cbb3-type subunit III [unclassified Rhizobacter]KQU67262.1 cytochrome oxidase subunit III [Rhizobacter sp. Root29]KQW14594.1 cytochrome oxidase subunit III [Rhizobacter sp. Root1238]KRB23949.1 cytochrome oxidase subunit III [Rhizobacter sp. Root16D2]
MSDFFSQGWSITIGAVTLLGLLACLVLLFIASRREVMAADNSTGHVWDEDLREMNNPLPMWWVVMFVLTVVFSLAYLFLYPGFGSAAGSLGWTSLGQYDAEQRAAQAEMAPLYERFATMPADKLAAEPQAMAIGERLFINHCAACHGSDARGSKGFPNLTDGDWLHGGTPEKIEETITEGRQGMMPPMAAAIGGPQEIHEVAQYVLSLSGSAHDPTAQFGKPRFMACAACHGIDGKGNQALGAPNLADRIWLHGWGEEAITAMINNGKLNVMPAQKDRLGKAQIHVLASYVWSLSNRGPAATP